MTYAKVILSTLIGVSFFIAAHFLIYPIAPDLLLSMEAYIGNKIAADMLALIVLAGAHFGCLLAGQRGSLMLMNRMEKLCCSREQGATTMVFYTSQESYTAQTGCYHRLRQYLCCGDSATSFDIEDGKLGTREEENNGCGRKIIHCITAYLPCSASEEKTSDTSYRL